MDSVGWQGDLISDSIYRQRYDFEGNSIEPCRYWRKIEMFVHALMEWMTIVGVASSRRNSKTKTR